MLRAGIETAVTIDRSSTDSSSKTVSLSQLRTLDPELRRLAMANVRCSFWMVTTVWECNPCTVIP